MIDSFLSNNWTIGIGGGLISGIIVYFITERILRKRENKEYMQKIRIANNEILYSVRPLVVENNTPTIEILNSIIRATARKYEVKESELYNKKDIVDELIKEIVGNPFLTSENKLQYSNLCLGISISEDIVQYDNDYEGKTRYNSKDLTFILSLMTAFSIFLSFIINDDSFLDITTEIDKKLPVIIISILVPIISLSVPEIIRLVLQKNKETDEIIFKLKKDKDDKE